MWLKELIVETRNNIKRILIIIFNGITGLSIPYSKIKIQQNKDAFKISRSYLLNNKFFLIIANKYIMIKIIFAK